MIKNICFIPAKLRFAALMSSMVLIMLLCLPLRATAHEVQPAIGDLSADAAELTLSIRLNAEAFLAGINLDGLEDTNAAENAADYDALRALSDGDLTSRIQTQSAQLLAGMMLSSNDQPLPLTLDTIAIDNPGNLDLPRTTTLTLTTPRRPDIETVQFGWAAGYGTLILRQQGVDLPFTGYLSGGETSPQIPLIGQSAPKGGFASFAEYIPVGFDHILPKGLDHILFVLGLFFLSTHLRPLLWQVSAFTLAHTVTLAAGALGWVTVPGSIVEPLIAASITYVAVENILSDRLSRWRPAVIFGFGLLHGLGFASVLGEFGLPEDQFIPALIGFNVGVEFGQLTVIAIAFLAVGLWFRNKPWYRARISIPASMIIAAIGAYWVIERTLL